jgi:16S rRNA (cytidine1402-2'-O)-methyltransferase
MSVVYLIPSLLNDEATESLPPVVLDSIRQCQVFFVEELRTARRFLKRLDPSIVIDSFEWFSFSNDDPSAKESFLLKLKEEKTIGVISEAGCPGVADPGQTLVEIAHQKGAIVKPLVGPSSILLALMASGLNGQQFCFHGYLPIDAAQRVKKIKQLEELSQRTGGTQIFMETPYRNNQLLDTLVHHAQPKTRLCIAADLTSSSQFIKTRTISEWKKEKPDLHKRPVIFCLMG